MTSVAFVTKSYGPDRARCELLCRSVDLFAPDAAHWIVVDAGDLSAFREFEGPRRRVVTTEELLPHRLRKLALHRLRLEKNIWIGLGIRPMRGWLVQQIAKLAICDRIEEDVVIHADSDVVLIKPFVSATADFRLFRVPNAIDERLPLHVSWHRTAERLLGINTRPLPLPDYIGGLVPWQQSTVAALLRHLENHSRRDWMRTLASARNVSEYVLYGRFVDDVLAAAAEATTTGSNAPSLCRCYWGSEPLSRKELESFIQEAQPTEVAVMISAKAGMDPASYREVLEGYWRLSGEASDDSEFRAS